MKRYFKAFGYLLSVHVLALLVMTLFRLVEFIALHQSCLQSPYFCARRYAQGEQGVASHAIR